MKCTHDCVNDYQWQKCPKCGAYVRVNHRNKIIRIIVIVMSLIVASPVADLGIRVLN